MNEPVQIFSTGLLRLRRQIAEMTGMEPVRRRLWASPAGAIAGWGHRATAAWARRESLRAGLPYIAFEDGLLRSIRPGPGESPISMVMDRSGIYYDARQPSDLETVLQSSRFSAAEVAEGDHVRQLITERRLSKYNAGRDEFPAGLGSGGRPLVIVVDQTFGDASIAGALAGAESFDRMLEAAVSENPQATVIVKLHPETAAGRKRGYLAKRPPPGNVQLLTEDIHPWAILDHRPIVYTVSSQFGFEALLAGCRVICFGVPFYAGWGLTDDRCVVPGRRSRKLSIAELATGTYVKYCRYFDAWRQTSISAMTALEQLSFLRRHFHANARTVVCLGIPRWKRKAVTAMLDGPKGAPRFASNLPAAVALARADNGIIAAWAGRASAIRRGLEREGLACLAMEDGFIRSVGLGAAFTPPRSLVFDSRGIYFDPRQPSDLEHLLETADLPPELTMRGRALRARLVAENITKYNLSPGSWQPSGVEGTERVLVPGQVSDDWAVKANNIPAGCNVNVWLLEAVRRRSPGSFVIFKPHPDVESLGRAGALTPDQHEQLADQVVRRTSLEQLLSHVDRVETFSSLAGFEALLRDIPVTTYGMPFYAGWGLTDDLARCTRRSRRRRVDELVATALILYPRYWDKESGRACPVEVALDRIGDERLRKPTLNQKMLGMVGRLVIAWRRSTQTLLVRSGSDGR